MNGSVLVISGLVAVANVCLAGTQLAARRTGSIVAGRRQPAGFRLYVAHHLVRAGDGFVLFGENGRRAPMPPAVANNPMVPPGVSRLQILPAYDDKTNYQFSREIVFGRGAFWTHTMASSNVIV
ncbi:MAG: hypothetical protein WCO25_05685 [Candidatus Uhrbacteria bacterium]